MNILLAIGLSLTLGMTSPSIIDDSYCSELYAQHLTVLRVREIQRVTRGLDFPYNLKGVFYPGHPTIYLRTEPTYIDWNRASMESGTNRWGYIWETEPSIFLEANPYNSSPQLINDILLPRPAGACDSQEDCEDAMDAACTGSNNGGVDSETVMVATAADGSQVCSGDCNENDAIAFEICN